MLENQFSFKGFVVWLICCLFFMYEFLLRTVVGTFQTHLMGDLHLTSVQFSLVSTTVFLIVYGLMQIPVGIIVDHYGLKKPLFCAALICGLSAIAFTYSETFEEALLCRLIMGVGASFGFISLLMAINDWMPHSHIALFIGLSSFIGTLGPIFAAGPLTKYILTLNISWQSVFLGFGIFGLCIALLVLLFVENNKHFSGKYIVLVKPVKILKSIRTLFARSQPWIIALVSTFIYFSLEYLSENEARVFLGLKNIPLQAASNMLTVSWLGYAIACPLVGYVSDALERRKSVIIWCSVIGFISIFGVVFGSSRVVLLLGFLFLGVGASGINIGYTLVSEQFKQQNLAIGFGFVNAIIMSISAINAPILGLILEQLKAAPSANLQNYIHMFYSLILIGALAVIGSIFFLKETYCKSAVSHTLLAVK